MNKSKYLKMAMKSLITAACTIIIASVSGQNIITVDNNPAAAADYSNLQEAINAAEPGDYIYVIPSSNSYGGITIAQEIHLRGMGHLPTGSNNVPSQIGTLNFQPGCGNSSVSGLKMNDVVVYTGGENSDNVVISNCYMLYAGVGGNSWTYEGNIINCTQANVHGINNHGFSNTTIHHNVIRYNSGLNFAALGHFDDTSLEYNNIYVLDTRRLTSNTSNFQFNNSVILTLEEADNYITFSSSNLSFQNCLSYNYNGYSVSNLNGENNLIDTDPMFTNLQNDSPLFSYGNNYFPAEGSPLLDAGSDTDNVGVYNDNYDFDQRGHAVDLPYITDLNILTPAVGQGETLEVNFSAFGN